MSSHTVGRPAPLQIQLLCSPERNSIHIFYITVNDRTAIGLGSNLNVLLAWLKQFDLSVKFTAETVQGLKQLSLVDKHTLVFGYVLSWFIARPL